MTLRLNRVFMIGAAGIALASCRGTAGIPASLSLQPSTAIPAGLTGTNLYVANRGGKSGSGSVTIYGLARGKLLGTITNGIDRPSAIGYDARANLVAVANTRPPRDWKFGTVTLYSPGSDTPTNVLKGAADPVSLAFDAAGHVYVADFKGGVNVYAPASARPIFTIPGHGDGYYGVWAPRLVAVDPNRNVYVANGPEAIGSQDNVFALSVFPPGQTRSSMIYEIGDPRALLVTGGHMYIAYASVKNGPNPYGTVVVYPLGSYQSTTITSGLHTPDGLAVDGSGNLYVANLNGQNVTVYHPGQTEPFRTITDGIHFPRALRFGSQGNLYVSNLYVNTVTVYKPGQGSPFLTIKESIDDPVSLTLDAQ